MVNIDVNANCQSGPFTEAVNLTASIGAGPVLTGQISVGSVKLESFDTSTGTSYLYWDLYKDCFDISGGDNTTPKTIPSPTPGVPQNGNQPQQPGFGAVSGGPAGNDTTTYYDCSGVAPSPGGQPCGTVVMQCTDTGYWSCGDGRQGIVPPGTFCAW
jgi:hypothetical protein